MTKAIQSHRAWLDESGEWEKRNTERLRDLMERLMKAKLFEAWQKKVGERYFRELMVLVHKREISPRNAVKTLTKKFE